MSFPRYPKYKDSGVEWLGEVPEHWGILPIKRIVAVPITDGPHETPRQVHKAHTTHAGQRSRDLAPTSL